jgi:hypothetical protein
MSKLREEEVDTDEENERMADFPEFAYAVDEFGRPMVQFVDNEFWNDFGDHFDDDVWS